MSLANGDKDQYRGQDKEERFRAWWEQEEQIKELPSDLETLLDDGNEETFRKMVVQLQERPNGVILWELYLCAKPAARQIIHNVLQGNVYKYLCPDHFRYIKAIYKLAEKKLDSQIWGLLARIFDVYRGTLENGGVYSNATYRYLRRRTWRTLRKLGETGDSNFVRFAVDTLIHYTEADTQEHRFCCNRENLVRLWLFNHLLFRHSSRLICHYSSRWDYVNKPLQECPAEREEAFPQLWDRHPDQLWRLIKEAKHSRVICFAIQALKTGNPPYVESLPSEAMIPLLDEDKTPKRDFACRELLRRQDSYHPDINVLYRIIDNHCSDLSLMEQGVQYIEEHACKWPSQLSAELVCRLLGSKKERSTLWYWNAIYRLIEGPLLPALRDEASLPLADQFLNHFHPLIQQIADDILAHLSWEKSPFTTEELLPCLQAGRYEVREAARQALLNNLHHLTVDVQTLIKWIYIPYEDNHVFLTQFFSTHLFTLVPLLPELIQQLWVRMIRSDTPQVIRDYIHKDLLGSLFFEELVWIPANRVIHLINNRDQGLQELGTRMLARMTSAALKIEELSQLAQSRLFAVRERARKWLDEQAGGISIEWWVQLAETDWEDTREWVFRHMERKYGEELPAEFIYGLLDSSIEVVRQRGLEWAKKVEGQLDLHELVIRMWESPHPTIFHYALDKAKQLSWDEEYLGQLELLLRKVLFQVNRGRKAKETALDLLGKLGGEGGPQSEMAVRVLSDFARNGGKRDFERVMVLITRLRSVVPGIDLPVVIS
ncbi:hypothetical protein ACFO25_16485 [Paenactinomyces guangxiensis]|uniref:Uncharacterized protein n=1 Tax=Paenactinomyces guangxiensis TaxID=1490290 RepID=A0A7W1WU59_9BACL|nr:hypothetical protein [Paenactinomyces guangxiensis]MBA4496087.1 hypothetical protein [Paenactinomyces guangxiensis]MBH8593175.1 hypothetical protein [Paenactinomyces guangxiensis]